VVSVSQDVAASVGQAEDLSDWPRELHARLIDSLAGAGAAAIAFDIAFQDPRPGDAVLAESMRRAGNVVLVERMTSDVRSLAGELQLVHDRPRPLVPQLVDAALATGPFTLPTLPELSDRVSQFWTFGRVDDETPSLPVLALQAFLLDRYERFATLVAAASPTLSGALPRSRAELAAGDVRDSMRTLRNGFRADPALAAALRADLDESADAAESRALRALIDVYSGPPARYLNLYGPPRTIAMIPYDLASADAASLDVAGKMVFVGFAETRQSDEADTFTSLFSKTTGEKISGVEIGATAFANLLDGRALTPIAMPHHLLLVVGFGLLLGLVVASSTRRALALAVAAALVYFGAAYALFAFQHYWIPMLVPLTVQIPVATLAALTLNYLDLHRQRARVETAFGYYVPRALVNRLAEQSVSAAANRQLIRGTCLFTDAEEYTTVSEALPPEELGALMNEYYGAMFRVVERHGGMVSNTSGDSMVALWADVTPDAGAHAKACRAALEIVDAVSAFNRGRGARQLPTRVGLESGEVMLGNIGAEQRFEYRAIGDIVNTASRLQGLNRVLRTRVLVSDATLAGAAGLEARDLGKFLLRGKRTAIRVHEPLGFGAALDARARDLKTAFAAALAQFERQHWDQAAQAFAALAQRFPDDGATAFYAGQSAAFRQSPHAWRGAILVAEK
jgi:adenylate cyclase